MIKIYNVKDIMGGTINTVIKLPAFCDKKTANLTNIQYNNIFI